MNVKVWMPSGQPIKRQMKKRPLQHKTRTLSNPITFAWDQGDVVGENDNWKSKITHNKYTVHYSVHNNCIYRIYSINRPGRLLNFWTLRVGAYSRWVLIRGWAVIKFSPFSAISVVFLFCKKTVNASNKTWRSNKARFSRYSEEHSVFEEVSY